MHTLRRVRRPLRNPSIGLVICGLLALGIASCQSSHEPQRRLEPYVDPGRPKPNNFFTQVSYETCKAPMPTTPGAEYVHDDELCATCHEVYAKTFKEGNVHRNQSCEDCHGPASKHLEVRGKEPGTILNPRKLDPRSRSEICLRCHEENACAGGEVADLGPRRPLRLLHRLPLCPLQRPGGNQAHHGQGRGHDHGPVSHVAGERLLPAAAGRGARRDCQPESGRRRAEPYRAGTQSGPCPHRRLERGTRSPRPSRRSAERRTISARWRPTSATSATAISRSSRKSPARTRSAAPTASTVPPATIPTETSWILRGRTSA